VVARVVALVMQRIGTHLRHLFVTVAIAAVAIALIGMLVNGGEGGAPRSGRVLIFVAIAAGAFILAIPYSLYMWWRFARTGRDDWEL
jgi:hypothetical protein